MKVMCDIITNNNYFIIIVVSFYIAFCLIGSEWLILDEYWVRLRFINISLIEHFNVVCVLCIVYLYLISLSLTIFFSISFNSYKTK